MAGLIYLFVSGWGQALPSLLQERGPYQTPAGIPACEGNELFTTSPVEYSQIQNITPLGNLNPSGHTFPTRHLYLGLSGETKLLAPGKIWVTGIRTQENITDGYTDYSIHFFPCKDFLGYFFHVTTLSQKLLELSEKGKSLFGCEEYETGNTRYRNCERSVKITLEPGEVMGTVGGRGGNIFDFGATDFRTQELVFANPSRWDRQTLHIVCALDYFKTELKGKLKAKLSDWSGKPRTVEPVCGEFEQDKPGTAQGVWFVKGTKETYPEDPHLALVHDNFDPTLGAFSVGTSLAKSGLEVGVYMFTPQTEGYVNRDFSMVQNDGDIYCYEVSPAYYNQGSAKTVIIIELTNSQSLKVERLNQTSCGSGPLSFSDKIVTFER